MRRITAFGLMRPTLVRSIPMPFLTRATFDYRRRLMTEMMRAHGFDALAFTGADFFQWATNFHVDVQTWERPIIVVVPLDGEPFAIMNELSTNHLRGAHARGVLWVDEVTIYAEHPRLTNRVPVRAQWAEALADLLRQRGLARGRIGVGARSEEHTSELQSRFGISYAAFCL